MNQPTRPVEGHHHGMASLLAAGQMITADGDPAAAVLLRTSVPLSGATPVRSARVLASAHGVYEASVNGVAVSDHLLNPGWTSYEWIVAWQEHDVTAAVDQNPCDVGVEILLGNGWYRGDFGPWKSMNYGDDISALLVLEITYQDGQQQIIGTSPSWEGWSTDITHNSLYDGQRIDARLRTTPRRLPVRAVPFDHSVLVPQLSPPVRRLQTRAPERIWRSPSGSTLIDFGQNLVGWTRFSIAGPRGTEITIRHAEALENGELATKALRHARATDSFVLSGGRDYFEPRLTFHGFRYAEILGWPTELTADSIEAVVVGSDIRPTGTFICSDARVNQLVSNSMWGQRGNFLSVPTDCPQRDERLGWTGDIAVYAPTAAYQFDVADFLNSWLRDLAEEQRHNVRRWVPWTVPDVMKYGTDRVDPHWNTVAAAWSDAAVWVPQALWQAYADVARLAEHYPVMTTHLETVEEVLALTGLWDEGFQFGDWLDPDAPSDDAAKAKADPGVVATACLFRSAQFTAHVARVLNHADADRWQDLADRTKAAFNTHYVDGGIVRSDCTTAYALALHFDILESRDRSVAARRLAELVRASGYRATTGFVGTPFICWALSENGHVAEAYRLLLQDECPSWLYQVEMGATTMWERWDSVLPDGSLNNPIMTSLNHYAFGAVCDWLYQVVAGVRAAEPGYRRIRLQPRPGPGIDWVKASYDSVVGRIEVNWWVTDGRFDLQARLPDGIPGEVIMPNGRVYEVCGGSHRWSVALEPFDGWSPRN